MSEVRTNVWWHTCWLWSIERIGAWLIERKANDVLRLFQESPGLCASESSFPALISVLDFRHPKEHFQVSEEALRFQWTWRGARLSFRFIRLPSSEHLALFWSFRGIRKSLQAPHTAGQGGHHSPDTLHNLLAILKFLAPWPTRPGPVATMISRWVAAD